ncbi:hypothetical protein H5410_019931 [Solanum commersonii]|uniref:Uncharacterized protein n=1 Tax=Solanum commersonii TaxID=4109 RepID=A0A9J5Z7P6_SOLCO|nr:hypothetical protein H5410_019931 [Solanum commersonii]
MLISIGPYHKKNHELSSWRSTNCYTYNDFSSEKRGLMLKKYCYLTMILLTIKENQLPFFVLSKFHDMTKEVDDVDDVTETLLRNLIADKQQTYDVLPKHFNDFVVFMDYLIDSDKYVNVLRRKGIISNQLGEDNEVANIFDNIGKGANISRIIVEERRMTDSIEITPIDDQIPLLPQTKNDEIEEGRKVDRLININERIDEMFKDYLLNHAYTPKMVSIGPYHKKNTQIGPMKKYKLLYLRWFLQWNERLDVKSYISELEKVKEEVLKCYEDIKKIGNDSQEFCEMLLFDGCFAVEFIRESCCGIYPEVEDKIININHNYIFRDLMLLENQLPFFVLDKLHDMTKQDDELPLAILVNKVFTFFVNCPKMTFESFGKIECKAENIKHLLHVLHIFSCHGNPMKKTTNYFMSPTVMPNATELSEAGVSYAKVRNMTSLFDIKFENGLMTIPYYKEENKKAIEYRENHGIE